MHELPSELFPFRQSRSLGFDLNPEKGVNKSVRWPAYPPTGCMIDPILSAHSSPQIVVRWGRELATCALPFWSIGSPSKEVGIMRGNNHNIIVFRLAIIPSRLDRSFDCADFIRGADVGSTALSSDRCWRFIDAALGRQRPIGWHGTTFGRQLVADVFGPSAEVRPTQPRIIATSAIVGVWRRK